MSINFRRMAAADGEYAEPTESATAGLPPSCSYCGSTEFSNVEDHGRGLRATCAACGGTMSSSTGYWQPELIGSPKNHPKMTPDPLAAGPGGRGIPVRVEDLSDHSRIGSADTVLLHRGVGESGGEDYHGRRYATAEDWHEDREREGFGRWWATDKAVAQHYSQVDGRHPSGAVVSAHFPAASVREPQGSSGHLVQPGTLGRVESVEVHRGGGRWEQLPHSPGFHVQAMPSQRHQLPPGALQIRVEHHHEDDEDPEEFEDLDSRRPGWNHHTLFGHLFDPHHPSGHISYSTRDDDNPTLTVHMMRVRPADQRKGVSSGMQDALRAMYPNHMIDHGSRTPAGQSWRDQYDDPGKPELDLDHPSNVHSWKQHVSGADWCRHRHASHCWLPRNDTNGATAFYVPQDRGVCPWVTASQQQLNCPVSEPGPMAGMTMNGAVRDPELGFLMTATWADVRKKAKRIRAEGGVNVVVASGEGVNGHVQGDTAVYETQINYVPGTAKVGFWTCGCAWSAYAWGRSAAYKRFEGRMCSHALALQFEAQSRGMFGRQVTEDTERPSWLRQRTPVQVSYDRDTGQGRTRRTVPPANMRRTYEGAVQVLSALDPEGVYPTGHGLELELPPVYAFVVDALSQGADPAEAMDAALTAGLPHVAARSLLHTALENPAARPSPDVLEALSARSAAKPKDPDADAPTHAGLVLKADDTGRILMLQRSMEDEADPAKGTWEFPGGGIEDQDSSSLHGAAREFAEEIGQRVPHGGTLQHVWRSGPYVGHVLVIPREDQITLHDGRVVPNPDDPDGDHPEQAAWWDPDHARKNPALREECKLAPWKKIKEATRGKTAKFDENDLHSSPTISRGVIAHGWDHNGDGGWHPDVAKRISQGAATADDLAPHLNLHDVGNFWHGGQEHLGDSKEWSERDLSDHVGHEVGEEPYRHEDTDEPYHLGEVSVALEAHRPQGWDPNRNPDDGVMGNSYLHKATELPLHKIHYNDHQGNWHSVDATGLTAHADGEAQYLHHAEDAYPHYGMGLDEFRRRVADYAAQDPLGDFVSDPPAQKPSVIPSNEENPASTGFATAADPPAFDAADPRTMRMPEMSSWGARVVVTDEMQTTHVPQMIDVIAAARSEAAWAEVPDLWDTAVALHVAAHGEPEPPDRWAHAKAVLAELNDEPEPALPSTTGDDGDSDDGWSTSVDPANQHVPVDGTDARHDPRDDMEPEIDPLESMQPNQVHASATPPSNATVEQTIAWFQASAAGRKLAADSGSRSGSPGSTQNPTDGDIAAAARAVLAKTALKDFNAVERAELIGEGAHDGTRARNLDALDIEGTHYAALQEKLDEHDLMTDTEALFV